VFSTTYVSMRYGQPGEPCGILLSPEEPGSYKIIYSRISDSVYSVSKWRLATSRSFRPTWAETAGEFSNLLQTSSAFPPSYLHIRTEAPTAFTGRAVQRNHVLKPGSCPRPAYDCDARAIPL
jgi:hypothetical protein